MTVGCSCIHVCDRCFGAVCANKIAAEGPSETEEQQEQHANVSRCWIKYTLNVLETSVEYVCGEAVPSFPEPDRKLRFAVDEDELDSVPTTLAKTTTEVGSPRMFAWRYIRVPCVCHTPCGAPMPIPLA